MTDTRGDSAATHADAELRDQVTAMIDTLELPDPRDPDSSWDMAHFVARIAAVRGRAIVRVIAKLPPTWPCGLLVVGQDYDVILRPSTGGIQAQSAELHEIGHLLFGDRVMPEEDPLPTESGQRDAGLELLRSLMPDLPDVMLRQLIGRTYYDRPVERRAELFGRQVSARVAPVQARRWGRPPGDRTLSQTRVAGAWAAHESDSATPC